MIRFTDVSVQLPGPAAQAPNTVLHPTTLTLTEPRIAIIGANGSGKSTLARLCNGLVLPTSGTVSVTAPSRQEPAPVQTPAQQAPTQHPDTRHPDTQQLTTKQHGAAVRRTVGFVFSDPSAQLIMPTVIEDVMLSLRRQHRNSAKRRTAALETLTRFGLDELAEQSVHTLSGGQQQLLAIASVLATGPAILIADEPTTLLDLRNTRIITDLLLSLPQQLITVTHDLEFAARTDRVLVVDHGRIIFDGEPAAAIAHYREHA